MPRYTALVEQLPSTVPFVGPETQERARGRQFKARLGANEMCFGPSPRAIEAMAAGAAESWMYGEPENYDLKEALAEHHGISAANIVVVSIAKLILICSAGASGASVDVCSCAT